MRQNSAEAFLSELQFAAIERPNKLELSEHTVRNYLLRIYDNWAYRAVWSWSSARERFRRFEGRNGARLSGSDRVKENPYPSVRLPSSQSR